MKINRLQTSALGKLVAELYFGVSLNVVQARHFGECFSGREIESLRDVVDWMEEYLQKRKEICFSRQRVFIGDDNV